MGTNQTINGIIEHNRQFVEAAAYEPYRTDKYPQKKLAVVSCMDTRLTELLPAALGLKNGDAKVIAVAGAGVDDPFGAVIRSLLVAVGELGVETIMVVAHSNCGAQHMSAAALCESLVEKGVTPETVDTVGRCGIDLETWLAGFGDTEEAVRRNVGAIRNHPLMPASVQVEGFIIDSVTGALSPVACD